MAAVILPIAIWALFAMKEPWRLDWLASAFAIASLVPLLQAMAGMFSFPTEAPLVSQYLSAFAITLLVARHAEEVAPNHLMDSLFTGLLIAALISTGIALYQWFGLDAFGVLLAPIQRGDRPVANVGQPNNLSTLLIWGLIAIWWALLRGHIGGVGATAGAVFLLMGVAITQSRTGVLAVATLGAAALFGRRVLKTSPQKVVWCALAIWFLACILALESVSRLLAVEAPRSLVDVASPRERLLLLKTIFNAISQQPWFGYGWNQIVTAHVGTAAQFPMHGAVGNAHNLVLDLFMWNGIPLGSLMAGGLGLWFWHATRGCQSAEEMLLLLALAVLLLHSMLELPHVFACFLLPAAAMMGSLNARTCILSVIRVPRLVMVVCVLAHACVLVLMFSEYTRIETSELAARMRAARIGNLPAQAEPEIYWLRSLQDGLLTLRTEPRHDMSGSELANLRLAVTRYPSHAGLFRYAEAAALNQRPKDAEWALTVLCSLHPAQICVAAKQGWLELASTEHPEMALVHVPTE